MKLHKDVIYYWIREKYQKSAYISKENQKELLLDYPIFPGTAEKMRGHIVVLTATANTHIVNHVEDALFILPCKAYSGHLDADHIVLGKDEDPGKLFNYLLDIYFRFQTWENGLEQALNQFYSYDAMVRSCDPLVKAPIALTDSNFHYVTYSKHWAKESGYEDLYVMDSRNQPMEVISQHLATPGFKELEQIHSVFQFVSVEECLHKNIFDGESYIARLAIPYRKDPLVNAYHGQILTVLAEYIERLYALLGTFYRSRNDNARLNLMLCHLLDEKEVERTELQSLLSKRHYTHGDEFCLVQFRTTVDASRDFLGKPLLEHFYDAWPYSIGFEFETHSLLLVNLTKYNNHQKTNFRQDLACFLRESMLLAGISRTFQDVFTLRAAFRQTNIALEVGRRFDPMYWYFRFDDYAGWYLLHNGQQDFTPEQIASSDLVFLAEYDRENGTELFKTLEAYLMEKYNSVSAADQLHISRSAFIKRMNRMRQLRAIDLDDFENRLYLALSFQLFREWGNQHSVH